MGCAGWDMFYVGVVPLHLLSSPFRGGIPPHTVIVKDIRIPL